MHKVFCSFSIVSFQHDNLFHALSEDEPSFSVYLLTIHLYIHWLYNYMYDFPYLISPEDRFVVDVVYLITLGKGYILEVFLSVPNLLMHMYICLGFFISSILESF